VGYRMDLETWPLIVVTLGSALEDDENTRMFADWGAVLARREKFVAITDARAVRAVGSAKQRKQTADWMKSIDDQVKRYSLGHATIISNALVRGALTALSWLHKGAAPELHAANMLDACDWCFEKLRAGGLEIPTSALVFRADVARRER